MDYIIISTVALIVAALTLFSGFGLGTLLMPAFALFFSVELAVAATAVVHLANNIFKVILVGRKADLKIVALFALPAAACAVLGALLLSQFSSAEPILQYEIGSRVCSISLVKIIIAVLIFVFALLEIFPVMKKLSFGKKMVPLGGALSGFFGGFSGHQGALRTAFLIRLGLTKEVFIGTVVVSAVVVDVFRLSVYGATFIGKDMMILESQNVAGLVVAGIVAAFMGSFIGSRLLKKVTMKTIHLTVGVMLMLLAVAMGIGII